jgi:hypothetical protein
MNLEYNCQVIVAKEGRRTFSAEKKILILTVLALLHGS